VLSDEGERIVLPAFFQRGRASPDKTRQTLATVHPFVRHAEAALRLLAHPFIELPEVRFVLASRGEGLDFRTPQLDPVAAGGSPRISGEFFVPFFVLVTNHEHKEWPPAVEH